MMRTIFVFLFGLVSGVALVHVLEGPLDWDNLGREAGEVLVEAKRGAGDLRLEAKVKAALALQKDFSLFGGISVNAEEGVVTLSGKVGSAAQHELAELIARGVQGVDEVVNELEIQVEDDVSSELTPDPGGSLHAAAGRRA